MKSFVYVNILGITKTPQLTQVRINRPLLDLTKLKVSKGTFRIIDYIATEEFEFLGESSREINVYNEYSSSPKDDEMWLKADGDVRADISLGEHWWLRNEKLSILEINYISTEDFTNIRVKRGIAGTEKQNFLGEYFKEHFLSDSRYNTLMYSYSITNFKRDFRGLIVELRDDKGNLKAVGTIKSLNVTNGVAVIDCDDITSLIGVGFEKSIFYSLIKTNLYSNLVQRILTIKGVLPAILGDTLVERSNIFNWIDSNKLKLTSIPIYRYIDYSSLNEMLATIPNRISRLSIMSVEDIESVMDEEDFPKINLPDNKELFEFIQFISGWFLVFDESKGKYVFKNIVGLQAQSVANIYNSRNLMNDLKVPKVVSTQFGVLNNIEIKWLDRSTFISITGYAGVSSNNTISFSIYRNFDYEVENELRNTIEDTYLLMQSVSVANLRVQIPEKLIEENYQVGTKFLINDIDKFFTFQKSNKEVFKYGIVVGYDKDIVDIAVVANLYYNPISPSVKVSYIGNFDINGTTTAKYKVLNFFDLIVNKLTELTPFGVYLFQASNDVDAISDDSNVYLVKIIKIDDEHIYLDASGILSGNENKVKYIEYPYRIKLNSVIDEGLEYYQTSNNQKMFFYLGVSRWI